MRALAVVLPFVWATRQAAHAIEEPVERSSREAGQEMAFYRKYTEGILQRYLRMSMEAGRTPSLLGKEMFRAKVTNYRVESFEDVVIFVHDVDRCLERLELEEQQLISRIALQQYSVDDTASLLGLRPKTVVRRYRQALDHLTRVFLEVKILEPAKSCQEGKRSSFSLTA